MYRWFESCVADKLLTFFHCYAHIVIVLSENVPSLNGASSSDSVNEQLNLQFEQNREIANQKIAQVR